MYIKMKRRGNIEICKGNSCNRIIIFTFEFISYFFFFTFVHFVLNVIARFLLTCIENKITNDTQTLLIITVMNLLSLLLIRMYEYNL